jgi:hypothetical protein
MTARPLLNVVCDPDEPMSQGPASVSWYRTEKASGCKPSTWAAISGRPMTAPLPFSWAPVMIVPVPSPLSLT